MENIIEFQDQKSIEEAAVAWLIKLDGDRPPSAEELAQFREWQARSVAHAKAFQRYSTFWDEEAVLAELAIPLAPNKRSHSFGQYFNPRPIFAGIGLLACTLAVVLSFQANRFSAAPGEHYMAYQTAVGEQQVQTLADGSVVILNTDTQIEIEYSQQHRKITLLQGEAHFDVVSEKDRPFEVYAGSGMVRAVGTAFSVYLAQNNIEVVVSEGKVDLTEVKPEPLFKAGARLVGVAVEDEVPKRLGSVEAGQSANFNNGKINAIQTLKASDLVREQSWQTGLLTFSGDPLSEVIKEINRYTPMTVEIIDPELKDITVGGRFKVSEIGGIFDVLEADFGVQVNRFRDGSIQLRMAPGK